MKSSFGKKLFRLLLLFALLPSFILLLVGYYLSTENLRMENNEDNSFLKLSEYFLKQYKANIIHDLYSFAQNNNSTAIYSDFIITNSDSGVSVHKGEQILSDQLISNLIDASHYRASGLLTTDSAIYQYSSIIGNDSMTILAGVIHGLEYVTLISSYQDKRASKTSFRQLNNKYIIFLGVIFLFLACLIIIVAYYFSSKISKNMSKPLAELATAANAISEGNFNQQVKLSGSSEMISLISNFNDMANKLEQTTAKLTQSERVAAWRHIARRFAHELKNPLQPILISLYQIEKKLTGLADQNEIKDKLKLVSDEIKHLTDLADRFSLLAKLPEPKLNTIDLRKVMNSLTELYHDLLKPYSFRLQLPDYEIPVSIDLTYFREAIHNLFKNAIEASSQGDVITFSLIKKDKMAIITIEDHGEGMSDEVLASARLPYYTTRQSGSGIGLAVVEKTINEINGQLEINSEPNKGTIITIRLPLANRDQNA
ncbi:MAG: ATP-binding protein [bacterium]